MNNALLLDLAKEKSHQHVHKYTGSTDVTGRVFGSVDRASSNCSLRIPVGASGITWFDLRAGFAGPEA